MRDIAQEYKKNGFCIAKSILSKNLTDKYIADFKQIFIQQLELLGETSLQNREIFELMQILFKKDLKRYLATLTLSSKLYSVYKIIGDKKILEVLNQIGIKIPLWQTKPVTHLMSNELKIPGGYHGLGVHQDWPSLQSSLNNVTIWVPFTKVTRDTFPMEVIAETYKKGLLDGVQTEHYFEIESKYYRVEDFLPLECEIGDVIFMSNFTIHRSQMEGSGFRLSVSARYEDAAEKTFVERNYPYTELRVVKRDVLFPGFPSVDQVKKIME